MVVRHSASVPKFTASSSSSAPTTSVSTEYMSAFTLFPIGITKNKSYNWNLIYAVLILLPQIFGAFAFMLLYNNSFILGDLVWVSMRRIFLLIVFSFVMGYFIRFLLDKMDDSSFSSYVYVVFLSSIHCPIFIFFSSFFVESNIQGLMGLLNGSLAKYICNINVLSGYSFPDGRSNFIYEFLTLCCYLVFFAIL
jgi:hypothetical protein